jgi:hypothetical protein
MHTVCKSITTTAVITSGAMVICRLESCLVGCSEIVQTVWIMSREWWMHAGFLLASSYSVAVISGRPGNFYLLFHKNRAPYLRGNGGKPLAVQHSDSLKCVVFVAHFFPQTFGF